jgi:hypothetical protein
VSSERGELGDRLTPLLYIPVSDIMLLQPLSKLSNVRAAADLVAALRVLHGEEHVVLAAHVVKAEVQRGGVGRGRQHRLRHDAWDVQFLPTFSQPLFRRWFEILFDLQFMLPITTALSFSLGPLTVLPCLLFL